MRAIVVAALLLGSATAVAGEVKYRDDQTPGSEEQVERGRVLFGACSGCHGLSGEGLVGMAPRLNSNPYLAIISNEFIEKTIKNGRRATPMIAWGKALGDEDTKALIAYIRNWQTVDGIELDESPLKGKVKHGKELFELRCSECHGPTGAGYQEDGKGIAIGRQDFLAAATDGTIRAIVQHGKKGTPMQSFKYDEEWADWTLTQQDIDSIILFLRDQAEDRVK